MWGKWRPSAEARRSGPIAVLFEQLLVRDGYSFDEACEVLLTNHRLSMGREELERVASRFPVRSRRRTESEALLVNVPAAVRPADAAVNDRDNENLAVQLSDALRRLLQRFDAQDRLIIAMRFEDGRSVADISTVLRLDQKALYRRLERLLRELRAGLEAEGLNAAAVMEILENPAVSIDVGR